MMMLPTALGGVRRATTTTTMTTTTPTATAATAAQRRLATLARHVERGNVVVDSGRPLSVRRCASSSSSSSSSAAAAAAAALSVEQRCRYSLTIDTRWADVDAYNHVNNVQYYSYFDTVVNHMLVRRCALDTASRSVDSPIALVVSSSCDFLASLAFPGRVLLGLRVARLGSSSVHYSISVFDVTADADADADTDTDAASSLSSSTTLTLAAEGKFVHVYVDPVRRTPVAIPEHVRRVLAEFVVPT